MLAASVACGLPPSGEPRPESEGPTEARGGPQLARRPEGAPARGKWRQARGEAADGSWPADLLAHPYLAGYRAVGGRTGVLRHDPDRAAPGVNLYVSGHGAEAVLMDMEGRVLHRWRKPLAQVWPALLERPDADRILMVDYWRRAQLLDDGGLVAVFEGLGVVRLDRGSRLVWNRRCGCHHDLEVTPEGSTWILDRRWAEVPELRPEGAVLEDLVTRLDPAGEVAATFSVVDALAVSPWRELLERARPVDDPFHTNTLELLDGRLADRLPAFRAGNLLLSILGLDALVVVDPESREVVWAATGDWRRQHQPTVVDPGRLLLFDNVGAGARSRLLEIDPVSGEVVWSWGGSAEIDFYSQTLGSCQRLPNGNTLVTESENGRAFEITPQGEVVWEFRSPHRAGERGELVATLFEVVRLPRPAWLGEDG